MINGIILAASLLECVASFQTFQKRIPNGDSVPFPCKPGTIWQGVGHFQDKGTGPRNHFGVDFAVTGYHWTEALCRADSDGDGRTNGAELGDPDCVWKENEAATFTTGLSHPGICDTWDSPACMQKKQTGVLYPTQQDWLTGVCGSGGLDCPVLREDGVRNLTIRLPSGSRVPPKETTYICLILDVFQLGVPRDQDFHLVAVTPAIDNQGLIHHIGLSACTDDTILQTNPYECGVVAAPACEQFLYVWTLGRDGECYPKEAGIRMGRSGYKTIALQLHWNNPEHKAGLTDSSGLVLHYTANLRPHDAGILMVGPSIFFLPPHQPQLQVHGRCASQCTQQQMLGPVFITSAWNHMHYAGTQMSVAVTRNNEHVTYLTDDTAYDVHAIRVNHLSPPFELLPGDEFHARCVYNTSSRATTTLCGMGAQDEMCFGFISYYPKQNLTLAVCLDELGVRKCNPDSWGGCKNLDTFTGHINETAVFQEVSRKCKSLVPCLTECLETIMEFKRTEPCMSGHVWDYIQVMLANAPGGLDFLSRLASCKVEVYLALNSKTSSPNTSTSSLNPSTPSLNPSTSSLNPSTPSLNPSTSSSASSSLSEILLAVVGMIIFGQKITNVCGRDILLN